MKWKNYLIMFIMLFVVWLLLNNSLKSEIVLLGLGISLVLPLLLCGKCEVFTNLSLSPKAILYSFLFLFTFIIELFKANFDVARRVITPSLPINPGIVEVKTKLTSGMPDANQDRKYIQTLFFVTNWDYSKKVML